MADDEPRPKAAKSIRDVIAEGGGKDALAHGLAELFGKLIVEHDITPERVAAWQQTFAPQDVWRRQLAARQRELEWQLRLAREAGAAGARAAAASGAGPVVESAKAEPEPQAKPAKPPAKAKRTPPSRRGAGQGGVTPAIVTACEAFLSTPRPEPASRRHVEDWGIAQGYTDAIVRQLLSADHFPEEKRKALHRRRGADGA